MRIPNDCLSATVAMVLGTQYESIESAARCRNIEEQERIIQKYIPNFQMKTTKKIIGGTIKGGNWPLIESLKGKGMIILVRGVYEGHAAAYDNGIIYDPNDFVARNYGYFKERYERVGFTFSELIPFNEKGG